MYYSWLFYVYMRPTDILISCYQEKTENQTSDYGKEEEVFCWHLQNLPKVQIHSNKSLHWKQDQILIATL
jgi:hypothetical protein